MWTLAWWQAALERALRFAAGVLLLKIGGGELLGVDVLAVDWKTAGSFALGGAVVSLLMSMAATNSPLGGKGNPSLVWPPNPPEADEEV